MRTLRQDAWLKVLGGKTTVEEVLRVTKGDRSECGMRIVGMRGMTCQLPQSFAHCPIPPHSTHA